MQFCIPNNEQSSGNANKLFISIRSLVSLEVDTSVNGLRLKTGGYRLLSLNSNWKLLTKACFSDGRLY